MSIRIRRLLQKNLNYTIHPIIGGKRYNFIIWSIDITYQPARRDGIGERMTTEEKLLRLPVAFDWVEYKGETVFVGINYHETERVGRPMVDIFYCATQALNHNVLKTVQWDKNKFKPSKLSLSWKP